MSHTLNQAEMQGRQPRFSANHNARHPFTHISQTAGVLQRIRMACVVGVPLQDIAEMSADGIDTLRRMAADLDREAP